MRLLGYLRVRLRNGYTLPSHANNATYAHVTRRVEAKKLFSHQKQSGYSYLVLYALSGTVLPLAYYEAS